MRGLSELEVLSVWEAGRGQHPVDRALTMLAAALPERSHQELAALPVGERDRLLLELRQHTFGSVARGLARCSACGAELELAVELPQLIAPRPTAEGSLAVGEFALQLRCLDSRDLARAAQLSDHAAAARELLRCAVVEARAGGEAVAVDALPAELVEAVEARLAALDPLAEVTLALACSNCGASGEVPFDAGEFLWIELAAAAQRLLLQVDALARTYGWCENDILSLSPRRRASYLELMNA
jgi:hypothetical protein